MKNRLGCAAGATEKSYEDGIIAQIQAGDAVVIPAGVVHQNLGSSSVLGVVGAHPEGQVWDMNYGKPGERQGGGKYRPGYAAQNGPGLWHSRPTHEKVVGALNKLLLPYCHRLSISFPHTEAPCCLNTLLSSALAQHPRATPERPANLQKEITG